MFAPFGRRSGQASGEASTEAEKPAQSAGGNGVDEIDDLKRQMEEMQKRLDRLSQKERS
jgi:ubiquinone biosynthesis protein UbiJ